ncbi:hypothetical protein ACFYWP_39815 [Actinacidiphila glaucinigra]|uniref:hypothetical protein n=1 Tax=Actinacidiphila glaucinigra TaxID=235986 RepID=UPI0036A719D9
MTATTITKPAAAPQTPNHPTSSPEPSGDAYTVTVYVNTADHSFSGYKPAHPMAEVTQPDGTPFPLTFTAPTTVERAADAAFVVGNRQGCDDQGHAWPSDVRSVSVGDVVAVTAPDTTVTHLTVDDLGFTAVDKPAHLVPIEGTRAISRKAAVLFINLFDSRCGGCGEPTSPHDSHHKDISGYWPKRGGGCGARFTTLASDYNLTDEQMLKVRPDLPVHTRTPA